MNPHAVDYSEMKTEERHVYAVIGLCRGKKNAVSQNELARMANKSPREVRRIVESLIVDHRIVICSSYDKENGGYFLPQTDEEIQETCKKLHGHALKILMRESTLKKITLAELLKKYQMEIPFNK